jgi:hypothetical protein
VARVPEEQWRTATTEYCALVGACPCADDALEDAEEDLNAALRTVEPLLASGEGPVRMTEQRQLVVTRLTAEQVPDEVEKVKMGLIELLPRTPITELLIEVDRWTGFSDRLTHARRKALPDNALKQLYGAQACNFG